MTTEQARIAERIADAAGEGGLTVAVCESLTSGSIASTLGAAPDASSWFAGSIVAYSRNVKHDLLNVSAGPVVCASAAEEMAVAVRRMLHADVTVAVTSAGGPEPQDDQPAGTVFFAIATDTGVQIDKQSFNGDPQTVVEETTLEALRLLERTLTRPAS